MNTEEIPHTMISPSKKGALAEIMACVWLLKHGYEVFRNITPSGAIDLVAWMKESNELIYIDVASVIFVGERITDTKVNHAKIKNNIEIRYLYVFPDGVCKWRNDLFPEKTSINCMICRKYFIPKRKIIKCCSPECTKIRIKNNNKYFKKKKII